MSWDHKLFGRHLATRRFGREFVWHEEIDSTNRWLAEYREQFTMSGGVVAADHQTSGRGRYDRIWFDRPGECLLFSVILKHSSPAEALGLLNLSPAIALADSLLKCFEYRADLSLKWPNDVRINGKKVAGILGQTLVNGNQNTTIVGVGINVSVPRKAVPTAIESSATSLIVEYGEAPQREVLLAEILAEWENLFDLFQQRRFDVIRKRWETYGPKPGTPMSIIEADRRYEGIYSGIGEHGQLRLADSNGAIQEIFSGEVQS